MKIDLLHVAGIVGCIVYMILTICFSYWVSTRAFTGGVPDKSVEEACINYRKIGVAERYSYCPEYWTSYRKH